MIGTNGQIIKATNPIIVKIMAHKIPAEINDVLIMAPMTRDIKFVPRTCNLTPTGAFDVSIKSCLNGANNVLRRSETEKNSINFLSSTL